MAQRVTDDIIQSLEDIKEENGVSRSLIARLDEIKRVLSEDIDIELRIDRVRSILDDLESTNNIPNYIRTQLWNVAAMLEKL